MVIDLTGINILVTGASRGIGKELAAQLADSGANLALQFHRTPINISPFNRFVNSRIQTYQADLANSRSVANLFDLVIKDFGKIDVLINNAGMAESSSLDCADNEWLNNWHQTIQVNLTAPALLSKKLINHSLNLKKSARIINIASRAAFRGEEPEYLAYASSKSGLVALTKSIAKSYGKNHIKAFTIAPGFVQSDMSQSFIQQYGEAHAISDIALTRLTEPKDISPLVALLASGKADHSTGSTFDINAGSYLR